VSPAVASQPDTYVAKVCCFARSTRRSHAYDQSPEDKDGANKSAAQANVRAILPDIESYNADNVAGGTSDPDPLITTDNGYMGMTAALLKTTYDQAFPTGVWIVSSPDVTSPTAVTAPTGAGITAAGVPTATNYCVISQNGSWYAWKHGPGGQILVSQTLDNVCTAAP
jgi:hypothetical protein